MKFRLTLLVFCCALAMQAQMEMNVDQLAQFIRSEVALQQHTDRQIAAYLKKVHLTEKLPTKTIEDLEAQGAGPKTIEALKQLQTETASLRPPTHDSTYSPATAPDTTGSEPATVSLHVNVVIPPPDSVRQKQILDSMRDYALNYTQNLPNFICVEVMRRWVEPAIGRGSGTYHSVGDILAKVSYNEGQEHYNVYSVGGKYQETSLEHVGGGGAISTGEFGSMMREIFTPQSQAEFNWDHWAKLRGRKMAVFHYYIDSGHTQYSIAYTSDGHDEQRIYTAYEGLVYADENTGEISRIKFHAVNIPKTFPVTDALEILDYGDVEISGKTFICPLLAQLYMSSADGKTKNEIEFRNYRKFDIGESITFGSEVPAPAALGADQTEEQPVTPQTPSKNTSTKDLPKPVSSNDPWSVPTLPPPPPHQ